MYDKKLPELKKTLKHSMVAKQSKYIFCVSAFSFKAKIFKYNLKKNIVF